MKATRAGGFIAILFVIGCFLAMGTMAEEEFDIYTRRETVKKSEAQAGFQWDMALEVAMQGIDTIQIKAFRAVASVQAYHTMISNEILQKEMGIPELYSRILSAILIWFFIYVPTKLAHFFLDIVYGGKLFGGSKGTNSSSESYKNDILKIQTSYSVLMSQSQRHLNDMSKVLGAMGQSVCDQPANNFGEYESTFEQQFNRISEALGKVNQYMTLTESELRVKDD